jgi:hypothetical protein
LRQKSDAVEIPGVVESCETGHVTPATSSFVMPDLVPGIHGWPA